MKKILIMSLYFNIVLGQTSLQIKQAKDYIKKNNLSKSEVKKLAIENGISGKEVENYFQDKNMNRFSNGDQEVILNETRIDKKVSKDVEPVIEELTNEKLNVTTLKNKLFFCYKIFQQDPALFQSNSFGAVNPDYIVGPSDEIILMLWGETQFRQVLTVNREGFIFIPEVGQVFVNGLSLNLLESKLFRVLSKAYASLKPVTGKPTTFLDISLGNLRPMRIQVLGEVSQPGSYTISHSATLFSAIYYFNGPTELGSLRNIHLIRGGEKVGSIDFYDFLLTGKKTKDQRLQQDDIIFIPKRGKTIEI